METTTGTKPWGTKTETLEQYAEWLVRYGSVATILMPHFERVLDMASQQDFGHITLDVTMNHGRVVDVDNGFNEKWHYGLNDKERFIRSDQVVERLTGG
jgi:hypothetical protein